MRATFRMRSWARAEKLSSFIACLQERCAVCIELAVRFYEAGSHGTELLVVIVVVVSGLAWNRLSCRTRTDSTRSRSTADGSPRRAARKFFVVGDRHFDVGCRYDRARAR